MTAIHFSLPPSKKRPHLLLLIEESEKAEFTLETNLEWLAQNKADDLVIQTQERLENQRAHTKFLQGKLAELK